MGDDFTGRRLGRSENTPTEKLRAAKTVADRIGEEHTDLIADWLEALNLVEPVAAMRGVLRPAPGSAADSVVQRRLLPVPSPMCGSMQGAQVHHRNNEPLCRLCQSWSDERHRRSKVPPGSRCGSPAGAQMHRQLGEKVCGLCTKRRPAEPKPETRTLAFEAPAKNMTLADLGRLLIEAVNAGAAGTEVLWVRTVRHSRGSAIRHADLDIVTEQPADTAPAAEPAPAELAATATREA